MAGNAIPQFTKNGNIGSALLIAANAASDGSGIIGTDIFVAFLADALNGSLVGLVRFLPVALAANSTTATVARIFASSKAVGVTSPADTFLIGEVVLPIAGASNPVTPASLVGFAIDMRLPAGWTILVTTDATPAAGTTWRATVLRSGDY